MRKGIVVSLFAAVMVLTWAGIGFSLPFIGSSPDLYLHPKDVDVWQRPIDIIGVSAYDITKYDLYGDATGFSIEIFSSGWTAPNTVISGAVIGDLFLYVPTATYAIALRNHGQPDVGTVVAIEGADGISQGDIFIPVAFRLTNQYFIPPLTTESIGDNEIATAFGGNPVAGATVVYDGFGKITITYLGAYQFNIADLRLHLSPTCGNDIIDTTVPEPATMLLLGSGLIGLAGFARKRFKK